MDAHDAMRTIETPEVLPMTFGQWMLLIFVGLFLLLMVAGLVTWVAQIVRSSRRHRHANNRKRHEKAR